MRIDRTETEQAFEEFAHNGRGVVIGAPGSGKSYLLSSFAKTQLNDPTAYFFFVPVDRLPEVSDTSLAESLGLDGDLFQVLQAEATAKGAVRAYFIVDALDAARSDRGRAEVIHLIQRALRTLPDYWRVIVSVRTYDAMRSDDLEQMFGAPDSGVSDRFRLPRVVCRHFLVPLLSDEEVLSASGDIPGLDSIWATATPELRELLRTPFALWLLDRIVSSGGEAEVTRLGSEVELLGLFWRLRVDAGDRSVEKRLLLERITQAMLADRTLSVPTSDAYTPDVQAAWGDLHSSEILESSTAGQGRTSFGHNILFDYAVSILGLQTSSAALRSFLEVDPSRALFLRPSLNYFFARLWHQDRPAFWDVLFAISVSDRAQVRLFTRVLPPTIVAEEAQLSSDLDPLLEALGRNEEAPEIASRVLQAVRFGGTREPKVWASVAVGLTDRVTPEFAWDLALLLNDLTEGAPSVGQVFNDVGTAARGLLAWAFEHRAQNPMVDRLGSVWLVPLVARTIASDVDASSALLRRVIDGIGDDAISVDYAYRLADKLNEVWPADPELAALFFQKVFSHVELSEDRTQMGGVIVALTSTRRQDFGMVQWNLQQHAPKFLDEDPAHAIPALIESINACVEVEERLSREHPPPSFSFAFRSREAAYVRDGSHFWDAGGAVRGDAQELMDSLTAYLERLADNSDLERLTSAITLIAEHARMAFIWRRLLAAGAIRPAAFTGTLRELLIAAPVLSSLETVREAGEFLSAALPFLDDADCLEIENSVVGIAKGEEQVAEAPIGRIIQRFPDDRLQTEEGRHLKSQTSANVRAQTNPPLVEFRTGFAPFTERDWLTEQGVDVEDKAVEHLIELAAPLGTFEDAYRNETPTDESVTEVLQQIQLLLDALAEAKELPGPVEDSLWAKLGGATALLAQHRDMLDSEQVVLVRSVLLAAAEGKAPSAESAGTFTTPVWSPAARNEAAEGLPHLLTDADDPEVTAAIRALAEDPVPSVRYLLAIHLWATCDLAPGLFWEIAQNYLRSESVPAILDAVARSLSIVTNDERQADVEASLELLLRRTDLEPRARRFPAEDHLSSLLVGLTIGRGSAWALNVLNDAVAQLPQHGAEVAGYAFFALQFLDVNLIDIPDYEEPADRALAWLTSAVERLDAALRSASAQQTDPELIKENFDIVDQILSRLYFNSGVYEGGERSTTAPAAICEFFNRVSPLLTAVVERFGGEDGVGLPASTAHHAIELLRGAVRCDPVLVVHLARLTVTAAVGSGYAFDSLASREVTKLAEELLSDHRETLREGEPLDDLMYLLDTFVSAGWQDAQHLVFRLEEIFR